MKKLFCIAVALLLACFPVLAEEAVPYFEKYDLRVYDLEELGVGVTLEDAFTIVGSEIITYPMRVNYNMISDEVTDGMRHVTVRMILEAEGVDWDAYGETDLILYAAYDYYTGQQFYIEANMQGDETQMRDFTVDFAGNTYEISGRITNAEAIVWAQGLYYIWDYEMEMSPDYDGLMLANCSLIAHEDKQDLFDKLDNSSESGLPLMEDMGDDAYRAVYIRVR